MNFIISFFDSNPVVASIIAIIVLIAIVSIVKGLVKFALFLALIAVVAVVFFDVNPDEIVKTGTEVTQVATTYYDKTIKPIIDDEMSTAKYESKEDGSYIIRTTSLLIEGKSGDKEVIITYKEKSVKVDVSALGNRFREFVETEGKSV